MKQKRALITGIAGQDGSYLAELLLAKGYEVHGIVRRVSLEGAEQKLWRLKGILEKITLHVSSIESYASVSAIVEKVVPDECYHLAAESFVSYSFDEENSIFNTNIYGTLNILSALRKSSPGCRFYFSGSSEMFGLAKESPQTEETAFHPRSPYGISKVASFHLTENYRRIHGLFTCSGILFNHESPRRGTEFVTKKITRAIAEIKMGKRDKLSLGNLEAKRDWGFAGDYVEAMWMMLQQNEPDDYVIATGKTHSVGEFVEKAFTIAGLDWKKYVEVDQRFYRPSEKVVLTGNASKAKQKLGWKPKVNFEQLVVMMVENDMKHFSQQ